MHKRLFSIIMTYNDVHTLLLLVGLDEDFTNGRTKNSSHHLNTQDQSRLLLATVTGSSPRYVDKNFIPCSNFKFNSSTVSATLTFAVVQ